MESPSWSVEVFQVKPNVLFVDEELLAGRTGTGAVGRLLAAAAALIFPEKLLNEVVLKISVRVLEVKLRFRHLPLSTQLMPLRCTSVMSVVKFATSRIPV